MKKILAAAAIGAALLGTDVITAGTASAYPSCPRLGEAPDATGKCAPIYSTTIPPCSFAVGSTPEQQLACLGDGWEGESRPSGGTGLNPRTPGGPPTITNPQGVRPVTTGDVYALICNDLDANGVSVASVENIYHVL